MNRGFPILLVMVVAGCSSDAPTETDLGCEGPGPAIEDCARGYFFAECGGTGEPKLACADRGDARDECYWFSGGCVARGFSPTTCPADDVCCHDASSGDRGWPYPESKFPGVYERLYAFGLGPWDRTRAMNVDVEIDPTLTAAGNAWTTCDEVPSLSGASPCEAPEPGYSSGTLGATLVLLSQSSGLFGWNPLIEIDPMTQRARVCAYRYTDVSQLSCTVSDAVCADAGTVTLTRLPSTDAEIAGVGVAVEVTFEGTYGFAGSFTLPSAP